MGLTVSIYRSGYDSDLNAFRGRESVVVVNVEGPAEPDAEHPAAYLDSAGFGQGGQPILIPAERPAIDPGPPVMFGGTYAASSDSRWREAVGGGGAIPVYDRYETWAQYERMSR